MHKKQKMSTLFTYLLVFVLIKIVSCGVYFPIFVAFAGNGKSVYDAWRTPSMWNEIPAFYPHIGRRFHLRSRFIDNWGKVELVKLELFKSNKRVMWMTFNGKNTNNMNWFNKNNLVDSSFNDLAPCSTLNYFSIAGDLRKDWLDRRFLINKSYAGCAKDYGWFVIADTYRHCSWEKKGPAPVFIYTRNRSSRNYNKDANTAETMVISVLMDI
ncbi:uncharacterized protein LOC127726295 [Mytilus californianus]|uniref:uncharacterized protein LOC127726295 n=1 Tax=Mytilus californianus TaxID=6549 RepID=UPI002246E6BC|nr:uncharacterized protein LOC127726295 [Mytilus californianus]